MKKKDVVQWLQEYAKEKKEYLDHLAKEGNLENVPNVAYRLAVIEDAISVLVNDPDPHRHQEQVKQICRWCGREIIVVKEG
jgi:hypothetical protein